MILWNPDTEKDFFNSCQPFATADKLFYKTDTGEYVAYWEKGYKGEKNTLQSRNSLIGKFTETWSTDLIQNYAKKKGLYAVTDVKCPIIALPNNSGADVALCKTSDKIQIPQNIIAIFEVKMSVVWNWKLDHKSKTLTCIGDYKSHQGNPGILRSDSMLKAIGKSINIRVSDYAAATIPIIILGNTPITTSYLGKVDHLKTAGVIQGFWSLNPAILGIPPHTHFDPLKQTPKEGFKRFDTYAEFEKDLDKLLGTTKNFFSSMKSENELGQIITIASKELTDTLKAEKFLQLIRI